MVSRCGSPPVSASSSSGATASARRRCSARSWASSAAGAAASGSRAATSRACRHARARLGLGYVPQGREIFPALSVLENLEMGAVRGGRSTRVKELLEIFPRLGERLRQRGGSLSGGEQQILAIARALMGEPKLLLLDEPTEGIQPSIVDEILNQLLAINARRGVSMILVEQNLDFACEFAQRAYTMLKGQITEELSPDGLNDPRVIAEYLGV